VAGDFCRCQLLDAVAVDLDEFLGDRGTPQRHSQRFAAQAFDDLVRGHADVIR
jgi:hypothetical protein